MLLPLSLLIFFQSGIVGAEPVVVLCVACDRINFLHFNIVHGQLFAVGIEIIVKAGQIIVLVNGIIGNAVVIAGLAGKAENMNILALEILCGQRIGGGFVQGKIGLYLLAMRQISPVDMV